MVPILAVISASLLMKVGVFGFVATAAWLLFDLVVEGNSSAEKRLEEFNKLQARRGGRVQVWRLQLGLSLIHI